MRIKYDREACQGHNRCYMLAPELFDTDDEGYAILLVDGAVPAGLEEKARVRHRDRRRLIVEPG